MTFQPSSSLSKTSVEWGKTVSRGRMGRFRAPADSGAGPSGTLAAEAFVDAGLQLAADPVDADAEGVHRQAALLGQRLAVADVGLSLTVGALVIPQHQVPLIRRQLRQAPPETVEAALARLRDGDPR